MNRIIKKLNSKKGVTIVMAMLFLLVSIMISSVVLAVANTATRKVIYDQKVQQAYLTVIDIEEYLSDEISKYQFNINEITSSEVEYAKAPTLNVVSSCELNNLMNKIANYAFARYCTKDSQPAGYTSTTAFTVHFEDFNKADGSDYELKIAASDDDMDIDDLKIIVTVDDYNPLDDTIDDTKEGLDIYITIESPVLADGQTLKESINYRMTLHMKSNKVVTKSTEMKTTGSAIDPNRTVNIPVEKIQTEFFWVVGSVEKGFGES